MAKKTKSKGKKKVRVVKTAVLANNVSPRPVTRRPKRRTVAGPKRPADHHIRGVCSITDPFCPAAKNAKWPDGTQGNTLTEQFRGNLTLVTQSANGNNAYVFLPTAPYGYLPGATNTSTTVTLAAAATKYRDQSLLEVYGSNVRPVSFGIIFRCVASATTAQGILTVGTAPVPAAGAVITLGQELYQEVAVKAIQPGMELSVICTPKGPGARDFQAQSTATVFPADWSAIWVELTGAGNSAALVSAEWFLNVEFEPLTTARALTAMASQNPPKSSAAEQAVSSVHATLGSMVEGGVKAVEASVYNHAQQALTSFMSDPLESIAGLFSAL